MNGPLHGIRVLDVTRILAGPFCTMLLADLGAEVIKIERPGEGDPARTLEPLTSDDSAYFISVNRGKKSITLNLATQEGQKIFKELVPHCDILVENFVPGTMAKFGLDYAAVRQINPRLIYASISGFGQEGPGAKRPALDIIVQATGGIMSITGRPGEAPIRLGISLGDSGAGIFTALTIVSALWERQKRGHGQYLDMSMLDCQITLLENAFARYIATGIAPIPLGSRHAAITPFQCFRASDCYFVVALISNDVAAWKHLCNAIECPQLGDDQRFATNASRTHNVDALGEELQRVFSKRPASYWLERLAAADVACGPVNDIKASSEDPQVQYRGMLATIPHSTAGTWTVANTPFKMSENTTGPGGPSPRLGEHTEAVLNGLLGMSTEEINALRRKGVM